MIIMTREETEYVHDIIIVPNETEWEKIGLFFRLQHDSGY